MLYQRLAANVLGGQVIRGSVMARMIEFYVFTRFQKKVTPLSDSKMERSSLWVRSPHSGMSEVVVVQPRSGRFRYSPRTSELQSDREPTQNHLSVGNPIALFIMQPHETK